MKTVILLLLAVAAVAAAALLGGVARERQTAPAAAATASSTSGLTAGFADANTAEVVRRLRARTQARPDDADAHALLGLALAQRARETGEAAFYSRAHFALRRALALDASNVAARLGLGSVALSRHRFGEALAHGRRAQLLAPHSAAPLGVVGDALLELGRYRQAFAAFDRMVALRPSVSSYARVAYARELVGDKAGAVDAMTLAVDAAGSGPSESAAFARTQLANLLVDRKPAAAEAVYREALLLRPAYAPAMIGVGTALEARGRFAAARDSYARALAVAPSPDAAVALAGVLARLGRPEASERAYDRAHDLEADFARHGGRNELETAMLDLDRDRNLTDALRRARLGYAQRPSIEGAHVLAWALYKNGRCAEARRLSIRHLRLGTPDTDGLYHRILIERCLGNATAATGFLERLLREAPGYLQAPPSAYRLPAPR